MTETQTSNRLSPIDRVPVSQFRSRTPMRRSWRGFSIGQLIIMVLAAIFPITIIVVIFGNLFGVLTFQQMRDVALGAGEDPGIAIFGFMFLCSPIQWWTGRSQVRVRKMLGIIFFLLGFSNGAMFVLDEGWEIFARPLLASGSIALILAFPLFLTSSRWSQRSLGMRRWRLLHKLTYLVAIALVAHSIFVGDIVLGMFPILAGFVARFPSVRRWLSSRRNRSHQRLSAA